MVIKKMKQYLLCAAFICLILTLLSGCGGGSRSQSGSSTNTGTSHPVLSSQGIPKFSEALTDATITAKRSWFSSMTAYAAGDWGVFGIIPGIAWNYNKWVDISLTPGVAQFKNIADGSGNTSFVVDNGSSVAYVSYTAGDSGKYGKQIIFTDGGGRRAILYHNTDWTQWEFIVRMTGNEIRHFKYLKIDSQIYTAGLIYRKDADGMNDMAQFWHTDSEDKISCVLTYGLVSGSKRVYSFMAVNNLLTTDHKTTGRMWADENYTSFENPNLAELDGSPSIFNDNVEGYVAKAKDGVFDIPADYPTADAVTSVRTIAATPAQVANYVIDQTTLESNF